MYFNSSYILDHKRNYYYCFLYQQPLKLTHTFTLPIVFHSFMHVLASSWDHFLYYGYTAKEFFQFYLFEDIFLLLLFLKEIKNNCVIYRLLGFFPRFLRCCFITSWHPPFLSPIYFLEVNVFFSHWLFSRVAICLCCPAVSLR